MQETHHITHSTTHLKTYAVTFHHIAGRSPHLRVRPELAAVKPRARGGEATGGAREATGGAAQKLGGANVSADARNSQHNPQYDPPQDLRGDFPSHSGKIAPPKAPAASDGGAGGGDGRERGPRPAKRIVGDELLGANYSSSRTRSNTSATGTSVRSPLIRLRTSTTPWARPRPTMTITGIPRISASANFTPGDTFLRSS